MFPDDLHIVSGNDTSATVVVLLPIQPVSYRLLLNVTDGTGLSTIRPVVVSTNDVPDCPSIEVSCKPNAVGALVVRAYMCHDLISANGLKFSLAVDSNAPVSMWSSLVAPWEWTVSATCFIDPLMIYLVQSQSVARVCARVGQPPCGPWHVCLLVSN